MAITNFLGFDLRVLGLSSLALVTALAGCDEDAADPQARGTDPTTGDSDDDSDEADGTGADGGTRSPTGTKLPMDASLAAPGQGDAGPARTPGQDAASGDAALSGMQADATTDAAQPGAADAGNDARTPSPEAGAGGADPAAHVVKVDSKAEWTASGFQVQAGSCYTIEAKIDGEWLDLDVPADLTGWKNKSDPRLALFAPLRRVVQDDIGFYQFASCVNKKTDHCFPVGTTSTICPKLAGELFFFVNDAAGFESNNVGTATVSIRAK